MFTLLNDLSRRAAPSSSRRVRTNPWISETECAVLQFVLPRIIGERESPKSAPAHYENEAESEILLKAYVWLVTIT
jgi:hypothetical protein